MKGPYYCGCGYCHRRGHQKVHCPVLKMRAQAIRLELCSAPILARTRKLKARWRAEEHPDIKAFHSINVEADLAAITTMRQINVSKETLLGILRTNCLEHRSIFLEAQKAYRAVVIKQLDAQLARARKGRQFELATLVQLSAPQDRTPDYERAIAMLELSVDTTVVITDREFANFVQDRWDWSAGWAANNLRYVNRNSRVYSKLCAMAGTDED